MRVILLILVTSPVAFAWAAAADRRPNIVLCMGDDHGWDETGYNGHPHLQTPVLDEMAAQGIRLDRFYAAHPTCSPTRGSVLTGRHPNRYGTFAPNWSIRPEEISIAQILGRAGYACGHFGKWHLGPVKKRSPTSPGAMGFDAWLSHDNFFEIDPILSRNGGEPEQIVGESSEVIVSAAIRFIDQARDKGDPFFVVVWFGSPHEPYRGSDADLALYENLPESYRDRTVRLTSNETGLQTRRRLDHVLQERYAEITAMDRAIGQLRQQLDARELRQNTLIWYCGDNGTPGDGIVTSPFRGKKNTMYEGGIRVPGIIEWPDGVAEPQITSVSAVTSDMLPTICDLLALPLPERPLDGISLKPLIDGRMTARSHPICFWAYNTGHLDKQQLRPYIDVELQRGTTPLVKMMDGRPTRNFRNFHQPPIADRDFEGTRVIVHNRYKLIVGDPTATEPSKQLFDMQHDQAETHNIASSHPDIVGKLERQLRAWQQSVLTSLTGADYR